MLILKKGRSHGMDALHTAMQEWWNEEAVVAGYVFKVLLACLLAMWLSLRFELEQPRTAMLTTAIVMQSLAGMVFTKSLYRFLGTLVGIGVSFLLMGLFVQDRLIFLLCMSLWIAFCTAGSMLFRNHQSYGFVLAGYTLCIVGLPATLHPELTFDIGATRISEILTGLFSAALVSDLVFPRRMWDVMIASVQRRFADFSDLLRAFSSGPETGISQSALLRFVGDIFSLESFHASTVLESDESRTHRMRLSLLNAEFMEVSTSFHALERLIGQHDAQVGSALLQLYRPLGEIFSIDGRSARNEREALQIIQRLKAFRSAFQERLVEVILPADLDASARLDFQTGAELIRRFSDELLAYAGTYAALDQKRGSQLSRSEAPLPIMALHFDPLIVFLAGLRGALVFALLAGVWILTGWTSGIEAITIGTVTSTLFAATPSPTRTIKQFIIGAAIASALTYVCDFYLLVNAQGIEMLTLAVTPAIVLAAWMTTRPQIAVAGVGTFAIFFSHVGLSSVYSANPVSFLNDTVADFIAILVSGAMYGLIDLSNSDWSRRRTARSLRELVVAACRGNMRLGRGRLEKRARDLVQRSGSAQRTVDARDREVVDWLLSVLEMGHAVIALREQMSESAHDQSLLNCIDAVATLYEAPTALHRRQAIAMLDRAMAEVSNNVPLLTTLHYMRGVLLDENSVLERIASINRSQIHAA